MKKILIVDDQPNMRKLVRLVLRDSFLIDEAGDADTAYQLIQADRPDAVVLDVMMPGSMDGYQLCELIKRDLSLADIHVVLITARGQVADQEFGLALGANAYFVKPFSPLALAQHLTHALLQAPETAEVADRSLAEQTGSPLLNRFEAAWIHSPLAMVAVGTDGNVCSVNPAFERRTSMADQAVIGMGEAELNTLLGSLLLESSRVETRGCELRAIHYLEGACAPAKDAQQLSQVGALLREPLASIFGFAELLLTQNFAEDVRHDLTETLLEQVEAMSNILNERLNFKHRQA